MFTLQCSILLCCAAAAAAAAGDRFCGVYHRPTNKVLLYTKAGRGKAAAR
jgi:hypothetical protein